MKKKRPRKVFGRVRLTTVDGRIWIITMDKSWIKVRQIQAWKDYRLNLVQLVKLATGQKVLPLSRTEQKARKHLGKQK